MLGKYSKKESQNYGLLLIILFEVNSKNANNLEIIEKQNFIKEEVMLSKYFVIWHVGETITEDM